MSIDITLSSNFYLTHSLLVSNSVTVPFYGTLDDANNYFDQRLYSEDWLNSTNEDKVKSLISATRLIDTLGFKDCKDEDDQPLEFPRNGRTPIDICIACYEIAIHLLGGFDSSVERANLAATSQGFERARSTYDRSFIQEYQLAGLPSPLAFDRLKPYLIDIREVNLSRV